MGIATSTSTMGRAGAGSSGTDSGSRPRLGWVLPWSHSAEDHASRTHPQIDRDLRRALLSGAVGWRDPDGQLTVPELAVTGVIAVAGVAVGTVLLIGAGLAVDGSAIGGPGRWVAAVAGCVALFACVGPGILWALGYRAHGRLSIPLVGTLRVSAAMVLVAVWTLLLGPVASVPAWMIGVLAGAEVTLTAWALGMQVAASAWFLAFERSPVNLGIVLAVALGCLVAPGHRVQILLVLVIFQVVALGALGALTGLERAERILDQSAQRFGRDAARIAQLSVADWLHDHVATVLHTVRARLADGEIQPAAAADSLEELEHRIRIRQLEESLATGEARLAEVIQPYVRVAQDHLVQVDDVPRTGLLVDEHTGHLLQRSLAVLVPNAIQAGARHLSFLAHAEDERLALEVRDDAGGFDLASAPEGRALDRLQRELGPDGLVHGAVPGGSSLRVVLFRARGASWSVS